MPNKKDELETVIAERITLINRALNDDATDGLSYYEDNLTACLLDGDGEPVVRLPADFVEAIAGMTERQIMLVLRQVHSANVESSNAAFKRGVRSGRTEIINVAHELLGIDRIVEALSELVNVQREIRGD